MGKSLDPRSVLVSVGIVGTAAIVANQPVAAHITFVFALGLGIYCRAYRSALVVCVGYLVGQLLVQLGAKWVSPMAVALIMLAYMAQNCYCLCF